MVSLAPASFQSITLQLLSGAALTEAMPRLTEYASSHPNAHPCRHPAWLYILKEGLGHVPYALEATAANGRTCGYLPLCFVRSTLFGRYLVSMPYLNTGGILADSDQARDELIEGAAELAADLNVKYLELRHEQMVPHALLGSSLTHKVHMRLKLPSFPGPLWESFPAKVRNQVRKGEKSGLSVHWGGYDLLPEFYSVFSKNMRDLGTPVYSQKLFRSILKHFGNDADLCVVRLGQTPISGALLVHGKQITEVPSASTLREYNHLSANMMMYWNLLDRAIQRGQAIFDFGRSTLDGPTFKFKKQWGAEPEPTAWQYHVRIGHGPELRTDNPRFSRLIRIWQRLPVRVTNIIGPPIVRGIP